MIELFLLLDTAEYIFLIFFIFETLVRMWALGHHIYFESSFNRSEKTLALLLGVKSLSVRNTEEIIWFVFLDSTALL